MKLSKLSKQFCKEKFNIKLVFTFFKIKIYFSYKFLDDLKSFLVYKFTCASCSSSYISEPRRYFKNQDCGRFIKDKKSHNCKHLCSNTARFDSHNCFSFKIIDKANSFIFCFHDANYLHLIPSFRHVTMTSSDNNIPCK